MQRLESGRHRRLVEGHQLALQALALAEILEGLVIAPEILIGLSQRHAQQAAIGLAELLGAGQQPLHHGKLRIVGPDGHHADPVVMGPGQLRIQGQRAIEMRHGFGQTPGLVQHEGEQGMRVAVARMERQQALQKLDGGRGLRGSAQQIGEIEHRVAIVRPEVDRRPIGGDGGVGLLHPPERIAEVVMGVGELRPEGDRPAESLDGLDRPAELEQHIAEIVLRIGIGGIGGRGPEQQGLRLRETPLLRPHHPQELGGADIPGRDLQDPAIELVGDDQLALAMGAQGPGQKVLARQRHGADPRLRAPAWPRAPLPARPWDRTPGPRSGGRAAIHRASSAAARSDRSAGAPDRRWRS